MPQNSLIRNNRGFTLPYVLLFALLFTVMMAGSMAMAATMMNQIRSEGRKFQAFYLAEGTTQKAIAEINLWVQDTGEIPSNADFSAIERNHMGDLEHFQVLGLNIEESSSAIGTVLDSGPFAGLTGDTTTYDITAFISNDKGKSPEIGIVIQQVQIQEIPLTQFEIFYDGDWELLPGPHQTFTGPVHANGDIYLGERNTVSFDSTMTSHQDIYRKARGEASSMNGDIEVKDANGDYQSMKVGSDWLDSEHEDWVSESQILWDGNVKSGVHGVPYVALPVSNEPGGNHSIIERRSFSDSTVLRDNKIDYKADLRIIDRVVYDSLGNILDLRYCPDGSLPGNCDDADLINPLEAVTFYNFREERNIQSLNLDIQKLLSSPTYQSIASGITEGVVIYHSDYSYQSSPTDQDALRLLNGWQLPSGGLIVASENPVYVQGDYNNVNKQPSMIMGDAFNILSNNWDDANASSPLGQRVASDTTINSAVFAGYAGMPGGNYTGGYENIYRYLEKWVGKTLHYSGATIVPYESVDVSQAGDNQNQYSSPNRSWTYDEDLAGWISDNVPHAMVVSKSQWHPAQNEDYLEALETFNSRNTY